MEDPRDEITLAQPCALVEDPRDAIALAKTFALVKDPRGAFARKAFVLAHQLLRNILTFSYLPKDIQIKKICTANNFLFMFVTYFEP